MAVREKVFDDVDILDSQDLGVNGLPDEEDALLDVINKTRANIRSSFGKRAKSKSTKAQAA